MTGRPAGTPTHPGSAPRNGMDVGAGLPRVLILPGLNGDPGMLLDAAPALFPGVRALAFDHRQDLAGDGLEGLAERALVLLDADEDGDAPAYICGESFGGPVALTIARLAPERVKGLLLFSTFGYYPPLAARGGEAGLALWRVLGPRAGNRLFSGGRLASLPGQLGFRFSRDVARAYLTRPEAVLPAYRRKCELSLAFDARPWLPSLTMPAFVLTGGFDPVVPTTAGRELARLLPNVELHRLPGGHLVHLVRPAQTGRLVAAWLRRYAVSSPAPV